MTSEVSSSTPRSMARARRDAAQSLDAAFTTAITSSGWVPIGTQKQVFGLREQDPASLDLLQRPLRSAIIPRRRISHERQRQDVGPEALSGPGAQPLVVGNPIRASGVLQGAQVGLRERWHCLRLDSEKVASAQELRSRLRTGRKRAALGRPAAAWPSPKQRSISRRQTSRRKIGSALIRGSPQEPGNNQYEDRQGAWPRSARHAARPRRRSHRVRRRVCCAQRSPELWHDPDDAARLG